MIHRETNPTPDFLYNVDQMERILLMAISGSIYDNSKDVLITAARWEAFNAMHRFSDVKSWDDLKRRLINVLEFAQGELEVAK